MAPALSMEPKADRVAVTAARLRKAEAKLVIALGPNSEPGTAHQALREYGDALVALHNAVEEREREKGEERDN